MHKVAGQWATIDRRIYSRILILGCTQIHLLCGAPPRDSAIYRREYSYVRQACQGAIETPTDHFFALCIHLCAAAPTVSWKWHVQQNVKFEGCLWSRIAIQAGSVFTTNNSLALFKNEKFNLTLKWNTVQSTFGDWHLIRAAPSLDFKSLQSTLTSCIWGVPASWELIVLWEAMTGQRLTRGSSGHISWQLLKLFGNFGVWHPLSK